MNETIITEDYVSFEVAKLLKEKGFGQDCFAKYAIERCTEKYYDDYRERKLSWTIEPGELIIPETDKECYEIFGDTMPAPTLQMAMAWIRGTYNIHIAIVPCEVFPGIMDYTYVLYKVDPENQSFKNLGIQGRAGTDKMSVPETCDAGIKYFLENLEDLE